MVISDEAHLQTNVYTDGARALDICVGAGAKVLLMSGTPIQNTVNDIGSQLKVVAPDVFPNPNFEEVYLPTAS